HLLNPVCFYLSPVALIVICFYSLTKRFTHYTHVFLGLALALAPVGGWLAVRGVDISWQDVTLMVFLGVVSRFRLAYLVGLLIILVSLLLEHWLARRRSLKWINIAFFRLNALVSIVFFIATVVSVVYPGFRRTP